jgi:hypothetical protein
MVIKISCEELGQWSEHRRQPSCGGKYYAKEMDFVS